MFALFRVLVGLGVSGSSENSVFEVRPQRASGLAVCLFLQERVKGLESLRVLVGTPCRCCGTELSGGIGL